MLDHYNFNAIQIDEEIIPIADIVKEGLYQETDYIRIPREKILPKFEKDKISLETDFFEVVSISLVPGEYPEVLIKPANQ